QFLTTKAIIATIATPTATNGCALTRRNRPFRTPPILVTETLIATPTPLKIPFSPSTTFPKPETPSLAGDKNLITLAKAPDMLLKAPKNIPSPNVTTLSTEAIKPATTTNSLVSSDRPANHFPT